MINPVTVGLAAAVIVWVYFDELILEIERPE